MPAPKRIRNTEKSRATKLTKTNLGALVRRTVMDIEEHKFFQHFPTVAVTTFPHLTWQIYGLLYNASNVGIVQGTGASDRIGNKIKLQGIDLMVKIEPIQSGMDANGSMCRLVVIHQKKNNGAAPTQTQCFTGLGTPHLVADIQNPVYENRITFHQDIVHNMVMTGTNVAPANTAGPEGLYKIHIPAKSIVEYNSSSGGEASLVSDGWYIAITSDGAACCAITTNCVVRYTDA